MTAPWPPLPWNLTSNMTIYSQDPGKRILPQSLQTNLGRPFFSILTGAGYPPSQIGRSILCACTIQSPFPHIMHMATDSSTVPFSAHSKHLNMAITNSPSGLHDRAGTLFVSSSRYPSQASQGSHLSIPVFPHISHVPCKHPSRI